MAILQKGKAWMIQLLSVACLSLAAKMEETEVPLLLDLQVMEFSSIDIDLDKHRHCQNAHLFPK